ncbi:MAG TPA: response regulator transcription factor [Steroidobacter sp.]|uniref:response regulator transcription factor n=1 Tax=Steroidobacter sp. TaxID=1978227 RepID=UPI002EDA207C
MQPLAAPLGRKHWQVAYAGETPNVRSAIFGLCTKQSIFRFCGQTAAPHQLVGVTPPPDIIVMDDALLSRRGLTELAKLHVALPLARTLLIGDSLQPSTVSATLRLGTWGVLATMRVTFDLDRALYAVAGGELWLSRRQLATVVAFTHTATRRDFTELTARENAVMRGVLLGQSNKQIARDLDIAEHTVKIHLHHAYAKLRVHSRVELLLHYRGGSEAVH